MTRIVTVSPEAGREGGTEEGSEEGATEEADDAGKDGGGSGEAGREDTTDGSDGTDEIGAEEGGGASDEITGVSWEGGAASDISDSTKEIGGAESDGADDETKGTSSELSATAEEGSAEKTSALSEMPPSRELSSNKELLPVNGPSSPGPPSPIGVSPRETSPPAITAAVRTAGSSATVTVSLAKANSTISPQSTTEAAEAWTKGFILCPWLAVAGTQRARTGKFAGNIHPRRQGRRILPRRSRRNRTGGLRWCGRTRGA